ncbi:MAG: hypothetical protein ACM3PY_05945 [Omnitrophica WOR_2 bacterium]
MRNPEERGPWFLLTGLIIGAVIGLVFAWKVSPVKYVDTQPVTLKAEYKDQYRLMIAAAFVADGDLSRAMARLKLLGDTDIARALTVQAQRALAEGRPAEEAHALGLLAVAVSTGSNPVSSSPHIDPTITPVPAVNPTAWLSSTVTADPAATAPAPTATQPFTATQEQVNPAPKITLLPTLTPTPNPAAAFVLKDGPELLCSPNLKTPLLIVDASDKAGAPIPGVEVVVNWTGGEDHFYTGLKPELGLGYADFSMTPGVAYTIHLGDGGQPVTNLGAAECETSSKQRYWGSWKIDFAQP